MAMEIVKALRHWNAGIDCLERLFGSNSSLPPYSLRRLVGAPITDFSGAEFVAEGKRFVDHFSSDGRFRDGMRFGDIGCGCGRMAVPLLEKVDYHGFDIVPTLIEWASAHIATSCEHVRFELLDVQNSRYNPNGETPPSGATFPFQSGSRDVIVASSIFTHLLEDATQQYLREISRCLAPGGLGLLTFFFLDIGHPDRDKGGSAKGVDARFFSAPTFSYPFGKAQCVYEDVPELMVGYNFADIRVMAADAGLQCELLVAGSWQSGGPARSWQDMCRVSHLI